MTNNRLSNARRKQIYRRDGYRCVCCDTSSYLQLHHVIPRGNGGSDNPHNLVTLCSNCHALAHGFERYPTMTPDDVEQQIVEYLSDYYADMGEAWNPYLKTNATPERLDHEPTFPNSLGWAKEGAVKGLTAEELAEAIELYIKSKEREGG